MNKEIAKAELEPIVDLLRQWSNRHNSVGEDGNKFLSVSLIDKPHENYFSLFNSLSLPGEMHLDFTFREEVKSPYPDPETEAPWNGIGGQE